jgi:hypothetical protein
MGLFPMRGRLRPSAIRDAAVAATNDARIVAVLLLLAAAALAWEMASTIKI